MAENKKPSFNDLTAKEIVELRLKCLEPIYATASRNTLEKSEVVKLGSDAWAFAIEPLDNKPAAKPGKSGGAE